MVNLNTLRVKLVIKLELWYCVDTFVHELKPARIIRNEYEVIVPIVYYVRADGNSYTEITI